MKRNQTLLLILLLIVPIIVLAETCDSNSVKIESLEIKARNGNASEVEETTKNGTTINANLHMMEVGDSIVYKAVLKNDSDEDYYLDNSYLIVDTDYMEYSITAEDESNIIEANSSKSFDIKLRYRQQVQDSSFTSGKYTDDNNLVIGLATKTNSPFTSDYIALYLSIFYLSVFALMYLFVKRKKIEETVIVLLVALLFPLSVKALCQTQITINSKINVEKLELATFTIECNGGISYQYYKGMTFGEWVRSSLYEDNIDTSFETVEECERIFGSNRGCKYAGYWDAYTYRILYYNYRATPDLCDPNNTCERAENEIYGVAYEYDTLDECKHQNGNIGCEQLNDKYIYRTTYYEKTEERCNIRAANLPRTNTICTLVPVIYKEKIEYDGIFDTLENCQNAGGGNNDCSIKRIHYYGPTIRETDNATRGRFDFYPNYISYEGRGNAIFQYDQVIDNTTPYVCGYVV